MPAWINHHIPIEIWDENTYQIPKLNDCTAETWQLINDFILDFKVDVITYPYWNKG